MLSIDKEDSPKVMMMMFKHSGPSNIAAAGRLLEIASAGLLLEAGKVENGKNVPAVGGWQPTDLPFGQLLGKSMAGQEKGNKHLLRSREKSFGVRGVEDTKAGVAAGKDGAALTELPHAKLSRKSAFLPKAGAEKGVKAAPGGDSNTASAVSPALDQRFNGVNPGKNANDPFPEGLFVGGGENAALFRGGELAVEEGALYKLVPPTDNKPLAGQEEPKNLTNLAAVPGPSSSLLPAPEEPKNLTNLAAVPGPPLSLLPAPGLVNLVEKNQPADTAAPGKPVIGQQGLGHFKAKGLVIEKTGYEGLISGQIAPLLAAKDLNLSRLASPAASEGEVREERTFTDVVNNRGKSNVGMAKKNLPEQIMYQDLKILQKAGDNLNEFQAGSATGENGQSETVEEGSNNSRYMSLTEPVFPQEGKVYSANTASKVLHLPPLQRAALEKGNYVSPRSADRAGAAQESTGSLATFSRLIDRPTLAKSPAGDVNPPLISGEESFATTAGVRGLKENAVAGYLGGREVKQTSLPSQSEVAADLKEGPFLADRGNNIPTLVKSLIEETKQEASKGGVPPEGKDFLPGEKDAPVMSLLKDASVQNKSGEGRGEIFIEEKGVPGREILARSAYIAAPANNLSSLSGPADQGLDLTLPAGIRPIAAGTAPYNFRLVEVDGQPENGLPAEKSKVRSHETLVVSVLNDLNGSIGAPLGNKSQRVALMPTGGELIAQVAERLTPSLSKGSGRVTITLSPESLGKLDLDILVRDNRVHVVLTAENRGVQQILQGHVGHLKEIFQQQGLQMEGFNVLLQDGPQGQDSAMWEGQTSERERQGETTGKEAQGQGAATAIVSRIGGLNLESHTGGINVFV